MANIKSQKKRNITNEKARLANKAVRSELKTRTKAAVVAAGTEESGAAFKLAQKKLDKAATKGVIHKNAAARRKSRLAKRINAAAS
ncbi:MAG: 30S ribosomal protein S20 [Acidimicrobiales bacterium]|nr:30S ribosomal protein S20 [Acidimicrobiales bacterium]